MSRLGNFWKRLKFWESNSIMDEDTRVKKISRKKEVEELDEFGMLLEPDRIENATVEELRDTFSKIRMSGEALDKISLFDRVVNSIMVLAYGFILINSLVASDYVTIVACLLPMYLHLRIFRLLEDLKKIKRGDI